ncbi:MAG: tetratricopeptide repeat protein, partial [bacterium]|nr:tetratricopeptide repeat protein [bacterium]
AIKYNPNLWQSYKNIASVYFAQSKFDLALENLNTAYKINPANLSILNNIGVVYINLGDKTKAKESFEKVLKLDSNNENAKEALGSL